MSNINTNNVEIIEAHRYVLKSLKELNDSIVEIKKTEKNKSCYNNQILFDKLKLNLERLHISQTLLYEFIQNEVTINPNFKFSTYV